MKIINSLEPDLRQNLLVLFIGGLLFWCSIASLFPTLPLYIQSIGGTTQEIGIVMGAFAIGLLLFRSWLGQMTDQNSRKLVLILGTVIATIAPLGYLVVHSIPWLVVLRAFHGVSIAAFATAYNALVVDLSPPHHRGEIIGYMSLIHPVGMAIGPAIGGSLQVAVGYLPLFIMAASLGILSFMMSLGIKESRVSRKNLAVSSQSPESDLFWQLLGTPRLRVPALVMLLIGFTFGTLSTFLPLFIQEAGINFNVGWFYSTAAIASFAIRLVVGRASDHYGRGFFITSSLIAYSVAMLLVTTTSNPLSLIGAAILEGAGAATLFTMMIAMMSDRSHTQERGRVLSLCICGFDFGIAISGPMMGAIAAQVDYRSMFGTTVGLCCLAVTIFMTRSSKDLSHSLRFAFGREKDVYAVTEINSFSSQ